MDIDKYKVMKKAVKDAKIRSSNGDTFFLEDRPILGQKLLNMTDSIIKQVRAYYDEEIVEKEPDHKIGFDTTRIDKSLSKLVDSINEFRRLLNDELDTEELVEKSKASDNDDFELVKYSKAPDSKKGASNEEVVIDFYKQMRLKGRFVFTITEVSIGVGIPRSSVGDTLEYLVRKYVNFVRDHDSKGNKTYYINAVSG